MTIQEKGTYYNIEEFFAFSQTLATGYSATAKPVSPVFFSCATVFSQLCVCVCVAVLQQSFSLEWSSSRPSLSAFFK